MSFGPYYCKGKDIKSEQLYTLGEDKSKFRVDSTDPEFRLSSKVSVIDVVKEFVWTASPVSDFDDTIPVMYVTELRQAQNSIVSSALYYINAFIDSPISNDAQQALDWLTAKISSDVTSTALAPGIPGSILAGPPATGDVTRLLAGLKSKVEKFIKSGGDNQLLGTYLRSYIGMYITEETGFKYSFPFFEGTPHNISNSWQSSLQSKNLVGTTLEKSMKWVDDAASLLNVMTPGTYIEKPRYFQYPGEGESITIKLPLLNTIKKGTKVPYQQNYELLWILAYQNKPYRTSFSRILPPKLYSVAIPGFKYMPYAYISKMDVNFLGTRRQLPVNTPKGTINTSIPEAYDVSITFTSLIADTGNLMLTEGFSDKINVKVKEN